MWLMAWSLSTPLAFSSSIAPSLPPSLTFLHPLALPHPISLSLSPFPRPSSPPRASASWCAPCREFTPKLVEFYKHIKVNTPVAKAMKCYGLASPCRSRSRPCLAYAPPLCTAACCCLHCGPWRMESDLFFSFFSFLFCVSRFCFLFFFLPIPFIRLKSRQPWRLCCCRATTTKRPTTNTGLPCPGPRCRWRSATRSSD